LLDFLTALIILSPIRRRFAPGFVNYKKGCTRLAAASDKAYQLLVHGRWFSLGTLASSLTKTGHHDIAEILLKVALKTKHQNHHIMVRMRYHRSLCDISSLDHFFTFLKFLLTFYFNNPVHKTKVRIEIGDSSHVRFQRRFFYVERSFKFDLDMCWFSFIEIPARFSVAQAVSEII
jgi:hypothetical protein